MNKVITEDIISRALNESIDEFMLEESMDKGVGSAIKGVWNGVKNAAAMYMDWRTNGQWNRKYNIQAKGNGKIVGSYYLNKWFKLRYNRLYDIVYGEYYGNKTYFYTKLNGRDQSFRHDWRSGTYTLSDDYNGYIYRLNVDNNNVPSVLSIENSTGAIITKTTNITHNYKDNSYNVQFQNGSNLILYSGEDETTPEAYIAKDCTPNAFIKFTQNTLSDGDFKNAVINYLQSVQDINSKNIENIRKNPNAKINYSYMLELLTTTSFYNWCGKQPSQQTQNSQQTSQQTQNTQQTINQNTNNQQASHAKQQPIGKKDPNWRSNNANAVPLFNTKK